MSPALNAAKLIDAMSLGDGVSAPGPPHESMLDVLQGFVHELRAAGLPVSMTENLDAMRAVEHVDIADRDTFKAALGATLVKHHHHWRAFETVFDVYFSLYTPGLEGDGEDGGDATTELQAMEGGGSAGELSAEELAGLLLSALMNSDEDELRRLAGMAVTRYAGMEPGRPVGGTYYLYRALRQLDLEGLAERASRTRPMFPSTCSRNASGGRSSRRAFAGCASSSNRRFAAGWSPTAASTRWPARCASLSPRTSTSCTRHARRCRRSSAPSTR